MNFNLQLSQISSNEAVPEIKDHPTVYANYKITLSSGKIHEKCNLRKWDVTVSKDSFIES